MTEWIFLASEWFVILLIYVISRLDARPKDNRLFGITLPPMALTHEETENIVKSYLKNLFLSETGVFIASFAQIAFPFTLVSYGMTYFFGIIFAAICLPIYFYIKANERLKRLKVSRSWEAGAYIRGIHEDDFWIRGIFYHNQYDSARQVRKRMGIGLTPNLAYASARWLYFSVVAGGVALVIFTCTSMYYMETKVPEYAIQEDYLTVSYPVYYYKVLLEDIRDVKILKETPKLSKQNGIETDRFARGYYYIEGKGSAYVCVYKKMPCLLLETKLGFVLLNDATAQGTYDLLEAIDLAHPEFEMNYQREDIKR